jgi:tRNA(adenine34) deaminase
MAMATTDECFMHEALAEAAAAGAAGDVPVGAVVVVGDTVIGRGGNRRERDGDPTAHAEMLALREAASAVGGWRVGGTLYVTQEPCPMCAGAIVHARIERVVFGCKNPKAGAVRTLYQLLEDPRLNHRCQVVEGVCEEPAGKLLKDFFATLRK